MAEEKKKAAALKYDRENGGTPIISAVGAGHVAEKILETARKNAVPIVENAEAANVLSQFAAGDMIPPELYAVVAEILLFLARSDADFAKRLFS